MNQSASDKIRKIYESEKNTNQIDISMENLYEKNDLFRQFVTLFLDYNYEKNIAILKYMTEEHWENRDADCKEMREMCQVYISALFQSDIEQNQILSPLCMFGAQLKKSSIWKDSAVYKELYDGISEQVIGETVNHWVREGTFIDYFDRLIRDTQEYSGKDMSVLSYGLIDYIRNYDQQDHAAFWNSSDLITKKNDVKHTDFPDFTGSAERKETGGGLKKLFFFSVIGIFLLFCSGALIICLHMGPGRENRAYNLAYNNTAVQQQTVTQEEMETSESPVPTEQMGDQAGIREMMKEMTLEEKVMQMFIISPEVLIDNAKKEVIQAGEITRDGLSKYHVGGINFGKINLKNPQQTREMLANMQKYSMELSGIPLFLSVDEEGGTVTRISQNSEFGVKNVGDMRKVMSAEEAYECGKYIGSYVSELGFNVDWAPVADVITNKKNTVVARRSFGSNKDEVAEDVVAFLDGLVENNVIGCLKHFPGHGGTGEDSHKEAAILNSTLGDLRTTELIPFQKGIDEGAKMVMIGHITLPNILDDDTPSTLSYEIVTGILREELGFEGVVVSDAMNMGAIVNFYTSDEAAVKAVQAGIDMILLPKDFKASHKAIVDAVEEGIISEERIDESVYRILSLKSEMMDWNPMDEQEVLNGIVR